MTRIVTAFVVIVLVNAAVLGYMYGFDSMAIGLFFALVMVGALAIAVARGKDKGSTVPARCMSCDGLLSPHAPYCKHCGEPVSPKAD